MSLLTDFYTVEQFVVPDTGHISAQIIIHKHHPVFRGHFPDHPVTPGVCMMQIIKELAEKWAGVPLMLKTARNVKFMAVINPEENERLDIELHIDDTVAGLLSVKSTASFTTTLALKFSGVFQKL